MSQEPIRTAAAGRLVGERYRLVDRLGAGGFGRVWRAVDTSLEVEVAVKEVVLPAELPERERGERLVRAQREARNAAKLRGHPNVVSVHDVVIDDGTPWIVMELVAGRSLAEHLQAHGPLSVEQATHVARAVLSALAASQTAGIVHRDVKPANVMLTDDGRVLLTDFGIAVLSDDTRLTTTGSFIGSVEYIAPERARGEPSLPAGDLFSLGATLYHAVEGASPFGRESVPATLGAVLFEQAPPPARAGALGPLITALLTKDPNIRPNGEQATAMLPVGVDAVPTQTAMAGWPTVRDRVGAGTRGRVPGWLWRLAPFVLLAVAPLMPILHGVTDDSQYDSNDNLIASVYGNETYSYGLHGFLLPWQNWNAWAAVGIGVGVYAALLAALVLWVVPRIRRVWKVIGYVLVLGALAESIVFAIFMVIGKQRDQVVDDLYRGPADIADTSTSPFIWYLPALALLVLVLYMRRDGLRWKRVFIAPRP